MDLEKGRGGLGKVDRQAEIKEKSYGIEQNQRKNCLHFREAVHLITLIHLPLKPLFSHPIPNKFNLTFWVFWLYIIFMMPNYGNRSHVEGERGQKGSFLEKESVKSPGREEAPHKMTTKKKIEQINKPVLTKIEDPLDRLMKEGGA